MNWIEKMIAEQCPNGVERVKVKDFANVGTGSSNGNEAEESGKYPFFVRSQIVKRKNDYEFDEEAIIIPGEGGIGDIFHYVNGKYALHQRVYRIHFTSNKVNVKFAYFYMMSSFKDFIMKKAVSATVTSIRKPMIEGFEIPLPPLSIQEEIVSVLDKFSELIEKTDEEIALRQKQYEYYREKLLTLDGVKRVKLGDVCKIFSGKNKQKKIEGPYPVYGSTGIIAYCDEYKYDKTLILVARVGANAGYTHISSGQYDVSDNTLIVDINDNVELRFIYYVLVNIKLNQYAKGGGQPLITAGQIKEIFIPLPPLSIQEEIVSVLDKFEALISKLKEERELRQKQYEYYREKLLTF